MRGGTEAMLALGIRKDLPVAQSQGNGDVGAELPVQRIPQRTQEPLWCLQKHKLTEASSLFQLVL